VLIIPLMVLDGADGPAGHPPDLLMVPTWFQPSKTEQATR